VDKVLTNEQTGQFQWNGFLKGGRDLVDPKIDRLLSEMNRMIADEGKEGVSHSRIINHLAALHGVAS